MKEEGCYIQWREIIGISNNATNSQIYRIFFSLISIFWHSKVPHDSRSLCCSRRVIVNGELKERESETGSARGETLTEDRFRDVYRRAGEGGGGEGAFIIFAECEATSSFALKRRDIRRPVFCPWYLGEVVVAEARGRPETLPPTFACPTSSKGLSSEKRTQHPEEKQDGVSRERDGNGTREGEKGGGNDVCCSVPPIQQEEILKRTYNSAEIFLSS